MFQIDQRTDHSLSLFMFCTSESPGSSRQYDLPDSGLSSLWISKCGWIVLKVDKTKQKINKQYCNMIVGTLKIVTDGIYQRVASWTPLLVLTANCIESIRCSAAFRERWAFSYIFTEVKGAAVCLPCWQHVSMLKERNLCHHYETLHVDKYKNLEGQQRIEMVNELLLGLKKQ